MLFSFLHIFSIKISVQIYEKFGK